MSEYRCRAAGCSRVFDSEPGRNSHEGLKHSAGDIERDDKPSESKLRELYHSQGLTGQEIAERYGVVKDTIYDWMDRYDIERRDRKQHLIEKPPRLFTDDSGYERFIVQESEHQKSFRHHQLLLIAEGENPHQVFGGWDTHHINGLKWDNRPKNLELLSKSEHSYQHNRNGVGKT